MDRQLVKQIAENDIKTKALLVIEVLSFDDFKIEQKKYNELMYKFSHCALSSSCSSCDHKDWEQELNNWYNRLVETNFI